MYHVMLLALLYGAFGLEQQPSLNVLTFLVWASAVITPFGLSDRSLKMLAAKPPPHPARRHFGFCVVLVVLLTLVWFGHLWTAAAQLFFIVTCYTTNALLKDLQK